MRTQVMSWQVAVKAQGQVVLEWVVMQHGMQTMKVTEASD